MPYKLRDHYFQKAKKEGYLARAVFKLQQIQDKHRLVRRGDRVLDLGAAPGSWTQLASELAGPQGRVVAVDFKPVDGRGAKNVAVLERDVYDPELGAALEESGPFDVVLSDMAPATTGIRVTDCSRSAALFERALDLTEVLLRPGGHFLGKLFNGEDFHEIHRRAKLLFEQVKVVKPDASQKSSKEIYILAMRFKKPKSADGGE